MCTFTLIRLTAPPDGPGYRIAFNRDEQRTRPPGLPPTVEQFGARRAILPRDPVANGTWIGVNDAGLTLALLNVYPADAAPETMKPVERHSRGLIIPSLLHTASAAEAEVLTGELDLRHFPPFTLLLADRGELRSRRWDGERLTVTVRPLAAGPFLAVSSGLGDALVEPPRRRLFEELLTGGDPATLAERQDAYHRHEWPERLEVSVCMSRADARTVSFCRVSVNPDQVELHYHPGPPNRPATPTTLRLPAASCR